MVFAAGIMPDRARINERKTTMENNSFDQINYALSRQLERLDSMDDITSDEAKGEVARAKAVNDTCMAMVANINAALSAIKTVSKEKGRANVPKMLGGGDR